MYLVYTRKLQPVLVIKMLENGRNNVFKDKEAQNKVPLLFVYGKILEERFDQGFETL